MPRKDTVQAFHFMANSVPCYWKIYPYHLINIYSKKSLASFTDILWHLFRLILLT